MERIHTLNANQLAKELQNYDKYAGLSQKKIKELVGGTNDLRIELQKLEDQRNKTPNTFIIGGKSYTEEQLLVIIQYHENNTKPYLNKVSISNIPIDALKEILYQTDINTLKNYCSTNIAANKLCNDPSFWKEKFIRNNIPMIFTINDENIKYMDDEDEELQDIYIERVTSKVPKNAKEWIQAYYNSIKFIDIATKFVDNAILMNNFTEFNTPEIKFDECLWLPTKAFEHVYKLRQKAKYTVVQNIEYKINENKYQIILDIIDYNTDKTTEYEMPLSKDEFILYLAKLVYFFTDFDEEELFLIETNKDENEVLGFYINDFTEEPPTANRLDIFPDWD